MVKHTQTIRRQQQEPTNCLSVFNHFVGLVLKGLSIELIGTFHLLVLLNPFVPNPSFLHSLKTSKNLTVF